MQQDHTMTRTTIHPVTSPVSMRVNQLVTISDLHTQRNAERDKYKMEKFYIQRDYRQGMIDTKTRALKMGVLRAKHEKRMDEIFEQIRRTKDAQ